MGGADEDWVNAAIADSAMVAELLVRLHRSPLPPPPKPAAFRLEWTVRQRRSKAATSVSNKPRKPGRGHRASPTTPLTWSDATTSFSGRSDESTRPIAFNPSASTRSKVSIYLCVCFSLFTYVSIFYTHVHVRISNFLDASRNFPYPF